MAQELENGNGAGGQGEAPNLTPYDRQFISASSKLTEGYDLILLEANDISTAFDRISRILHIKDLDLVYGPPRDFDIDGNPLNGEDGIQYNFDIISSKMSYMYELLSALNERLSAHAQNGNTMQVTTPNIASPQQVQVSSKPTGVKAAIQSFLGMFKDTQQKEREAALAMFSGLLQQIGQCTERLNTFTMQHEQFSRTYQRWGKDVMSGYRDTELRNFRHLRNVVSMVIDGGVRVHKDQREDRLATVAGNIAASAGAKAADQEMYRQMGYGQGMAMKSVGNKTGP
jgi:hypothetical protein